MPKIISGGESHGIPKFATRFRFMIATTAAATTSRNPITRRVVVDKIYLLKLVKLTTQILKCGGFVAIHRRDLERLILQPLKVAG